METVILALIVFSLCFAGVAIRLFFKKEFRGTCASNNPLLKDSDGSCTVCGQKKTEPCGKEESKG